MTSTHPVIEFLATNSLKDLESHGVYSRESNVNPGVFSINYDQLEAVDQDPLCCASRGLVVRQMSGAPKEAGLYTVLSFPLPRFFNWGQGAAVDIDWVNCDFETKMDGTLLIVSYYEGRRYAITADGETIETGSWNIATRSVPDANIATDDGRTFADKFWQATALADNTWVGDMLELEDGLHTLLFEYTSHDNHIGVVYDESKLTLLARFETQTGIETTPSREVCEANGYRRPPLYHFDSPEAAKAFCDSQPGHLFEGVVAVDRVTRNRVKIKNLQYLALAKVLTRAGSNTGLMTLILGGTIDDVKPYLPKPTVDKVEKMEWALRAWIGQMDGMVDRLRAEVDPASPNPRKDAAMIIKGEPTMMSWVGILLDIWTGRRAGFASFLKEEKKPSELEKVTETILARI